VQLARGERHQVFGRLLHTGFRHGFAIAIAIAIAIATFERHMPAPCVEAHRDGCSGFEIPILAHLGVVDEALTANTGKQCLG
jgi:hypothetical protein